VKERVAVPAGTKVMTLENADGDTVAVKTARPLREIGWPGMRTTVHLSIGPARHTAAEDERWGTVMVRGTSVARAPAVATGSLGEPSLGWRLRHLP
jgi:hypothetical protein